jgi:hypothetical protein
METPSRAAVAGTGTVSLPPVVAVVVVASLVAFFPWLKAHDPVPVATNAEVVSFVAVVSLALLFPLLLDWAVEVVGRFVAADVGGVHADKKMVQYPLNDGEKATLFVGLAVGPAVALASDAFICASCAHRVDFGTLYNTAARYQIVAVVGTLWASLHRLDPTVWGRASTVLGVAVLTVAVNISSGPYQVYGPGANIASLVLLAVAMLGLIVPATRWLQQTLPKIRRQGAEKEDFNPGGIIDGTATETANPSRLVFLASYVVIGTASSVAILLMLAVTEPTQPLDTFMTVIFLGFFAGLEVFLLLHVMLVKLKFIYRLADVLQAKKAFMRYTAHEIRTPLNAAMLGINLLLTALHGVDEAARDDLDNEMLDTANDVSKVRPI